MDFYWILVLVVVIFASMKLEEADAEAKQLLISCGSNSSVNVDGRVWVGDLVPGDNFTLSSSGIIASIDTIDEDSTYRDLYKTARFFNTTSIYNFSIASGYYYLRLHFYPFSFQNFSVNDSSFDVTANSLKLVSKFNVHSEILWKNSRSNSSLKSMMKEYLVGVDDRGLGLEFTHDVKSFSFVNAIEIVPVIDEMFVDHVKKVDGGSSLSLRDRGMETMYRLNVGGPEIVDSNLSRKWESDGKFMFAIDTSITISNISNISYASVNESFITPLSVYETARTMADSQLTDNKFNISWRFDVDPNFDYLVRLHFCDFVSEKPSQRVFSVYINNKTAAQNYDVFAHARGRSKAYHEDFVDMVSQKFDSLWLQLGPDSGAASVSDAILNGVEIFKLGRNGNLAHVLSHIDVTGEGSSSNKLRSKLVGIIIGISIGLAILAICVGLIYLYVYRKKAINAKETPAPPGLRSLFLHGITGSTTAARACRSVATMRTGKMFTLAEIRTATENFDESLVIGTGGFGKVYKGELNGELVAIKRAHPHSQQGLKEFETEIEILSRLRHRHLVSMIGYCDEQNEMILVYEYMAQGTLRSHLFGSDLPSLTWNQRLEACIGAARGLHYLHTGAGGERGIIHRDVKTTNILLDELFVAKVADFGLSKDAPALDQTHVSTAVKGSFGYLDPEYFRRQQLTQKSDVYSFGVVLFEVICARPVINPTLPRDQINLAEWALLWQRRQSLETIMDPKLKGEYSPESLKKLAEIAEKCLADEGKDRPTMGEVLRHLEYALQLHEAVKNGNAESLTMSEEKYADNSCSLPQIKEADEETAALQRGSFNGSSSEL